MFIWSLSNKIYHQGDKKAHFCVINLQYSAVPSRLCQAIEAHKQHLRIRISWLMGRTLLMLLKQQWKINLSLNSNLVSNRCFKWRRKGEKLLYITPIALLIYDSLQPLCWNQHTWNLPQLKWTSLSLKVNYNYTIWAWYYNLLQDEVKQS